MVNQQRKENAMTKPTPTEHVRIGAISAAIWANTTDSGTRYGVTIERLYRDPESGNWKSTSSFNRDDMLVLAKVADLVHTRIYELQARDRSQDREGPSHCAWGPPRRQLHHQLHHRGPLVRKCGPKPRDERGSIERVCLTGRTGP
jgi:hypothetical protein